MVVGHVAPEAQAGGIIALLREGDMVTIDSNRKVLAVDVSDSELIERKKGWSPKKIAYTWGALAKYAKLVSSASEGAVTG